MSERDKLAAAIETKFEQVLRELSSTANLALTLMGRIEACERKLDNARQLVHSLQNEALMDALDDGGS